jgi:hypothetical protein
LLKNTIIFVLLLLTTHSSATEIWDEKDSIQVEFLGKYFSFPIQKKPENFQGNVNLENLQKYTESLHSIGLENIGKALIKIQKKESLDDWIFYQLIRKTSQELIRKSDDYNGYTICKWFFLKEVGFEPLLSIANNKLLMYVKSDDVIYNQPIKSISQQQYVCLNYHDFGYKIDVSTENFINFSSHNQESKNFSFKINELPNFEKSNYQNKEIVFRYKQSDDKINIKVNPKIGTYFTNYPVVDYESQFNIPLSKETYQSLMPALKEKTKKLTINKGVEYLMLFTRHAFLYERDTEIFGREKRFSPEETLLNEKSDCEDRSALFYLLVKEIYDLPMVVLTFPDHVTVAVKLNIFNKNPIVYKGESYSICEPTPQKKELKMGSVMPNLAKQPYEIVYAYTPINK